MRLRVRPLWQILERPSPIADLKEALGCAKAGKLDDSDRRRRRQVDACLESVGSLPPFRRLKMADRLQVPQMQGDGLSRLLCERGTYEMAVAYALLDRTDRGVISGMSDLSSCYPYRNLAAGQGRIHLFMQGKLEANTGIVREQPDNGHAHGPAKRIKAHLHESEGFPGLTDNEGADIGARVSG